MSGVLEAAREIREKGSFGYLDRSATSQGTEQLPALTEGSNLRNGLIS
jgi:hypothetical protein